MSGEGWRISFQRRVGEGSSANRGALPFVYRASAARCLVPLPDNETLWVGVQCGRDVTVSGSSAEGEPVRQVVVASTDAERLDALDAVLRNGRWAAIDATTIDRRNSATAAEPQMFITVARNRAPIATLEIEFVTPDHYKSLAGTAVPPTAERDGFRGYRLP